MGIIEAARSWVGRQLDGYVAKAMPGGVGGGMPGFSPVADAFRKRMQPTRRQLLDCVRGFSYACVNINAHATASVPLRLYLRTEAHRAPFEGKLTIRDGYDLGVAPVHRKTIDRLAEESSPYVRQYIRKFAAGNQHKLQEITDNHAILDVLKTVNPYMNQYELIYLTQFELDVTGEAYWFPARNGAGGVGEIWPLESWRMRPLPSLKGDTPLEGYEYSGQRGAQKYAMDQLIQFRYVSPHDPYATGYSPIRGAYEYVELANELHAYETAVVNNRARPDVMVTPRETISRGMALRLEQRINERFRRGGAGGMLVGEYGYDVKPFAWSPTDLGNIAMRKACEEIIAADLGVPLSLLRIEDSNRSVSEAGHYQHAKLAVQPRLVMIEQKLNQKFVSIFDDKLLLAFDNPIPEDHEQKRADRQSNISCGVTSINEEREKEGLDPVDGGDEPLVNPSMIPLSKLPEAFANSMQAMKPQGMGAMAPGGGIAKAVGVSRKHMARIRRAVAEQVDRRFEEERKAAMGRPESVWPDLAFQGEQP